MTNSFHAPMAAGQPLKPWLVLGPFYQDLSAQVQGLTLYEALGATVGITAMSDVVDQARPILAADHREGELADFRGKAGQWSLLRRPEKYLAWGTYNISNHLASVFLHTRITPNQAGPRHWKLTLRITSRAIVYINGEPVFDAEALPGQSDGLTYRYEFDAPLQAGENAVAVAVFRLGRMAQVGFQLQVDADVVAEAPGSDGLDSQTRAQLEQSVASVRLGRDIFYPDDTVGIRLGVVPPGDTALSVRFIGPTGETRHATVARAAGPVTLCQGSDLSDGIYGLVCEWRHGDTPITALTYEIRKVTPVPAPAGYERLPERKKIALEYYASETEMTDIAPSHQMIWVEVARYALGRYTEVNERAIAAVCEFIADRKDCADFAIQGVLRLMAWERRQQRLSSPLNAMMKDIILGFKYWVDEPGDTVMYMGSENHRLLFHVAEWLAGQLFPLEEFTNSRQHGLYHATKGRTYITEWLRQRGRFGFDEWHSNSYYPICFAPLLNVYDFAIFEDAKLRQMAGAVLDTMFFNLAADSLQGVFGVTHGRSYGRDIKYPDYEGTASSSWTLFGRGALARGTSGMAPVSIATSVYALPSLIFDMATDDEAVVESRLRHGILPGRARHANFCVYRTPDYLMSSVQDHRKGEYEPATMVAQVTFSNKALIFWSCPQTVSEGSGLRPDYWSGHTTLPRVIQHRNVMALTWRLSEFAWLTHCFFEQERFDEVRLLGNWAFARVGQGYVGIYSQHGLRVGEIGPYAGRELQCEAEENTWLVEAGREADWGSFDRFVDALQSATITTDNGAIHYASPSIGQFVTGWDVAPTVNARPIQLTRYPLVDSPWGQSAFGSGELTLTYGDDVYEIWHNQ